jgi:hypothetical protein
MNALCWKFFGRRLDSLFNTPPLPFLLQKVGEYLLTSHDQGSQQFCYLRITIPTPSLTLFCTFVSEFGSCVRT